MLVHTHVASQLILPVLYPIAYLAKSNVAGTVHVHTVAPAN